MPSSPDDRARRLAEQLRANLRRRKEQAREAAAHAPGSDSDATPTA